MDWTKPIFNYCERAENIGLLAEPFNAVTNLAFMIAAVFAFLLFQKQKNKPSQSWIVYSLIALVFIIGVGSSLFHTFANRWSALADVVPIMLFILLYLGFALSFLLRLPWYGVIAGFALFFAAATAVGAIRCEDGPCFNGTLSYAPALAAMLVIGGLLWFKKHPAWPYLIVAGGVFFISAVFRTVDFIFCDTVAMSHHHIGTHFLWHILNAITLYLLLRAAIFYGNNIKE